MKNYTLILFCVITNFAIGQDTIYLDDNFKEIKSFKEASFYKTKAKLDNNNILERFYYKSGQIKSETEFKLTKNDKKIYNGNHKSWYESGALRFVAFYENGKKNGEFLSYWKNGILKRKDYYKNGKLNKGDCWDVNGEKVKYYNFEIHPKYPGGNSKMVQFINKNLRYPPLSQKYNLGGKVVVDFKINTDGTVYDIKIREGINAELDEEATRIIKSMPKWSPGYHDGIAVSVKYSIPIVFNP